MGDGRYLVSLEQDEGPNVLALKMAESQKMMAKWPCPKGWYWILTGVSTNSTYVGLALVEDAGYRPPGYHWRRPRVKVGLFDTEKQELEWVATVRSNSDSGMNLRTIVPSDDGKYAAIGGWHNGVALVDLENDKLLWAHRPPRAVSLTYAVFGPEHKKVYAGGGEGCVYEMAVADGKVLGRWFASPTGKSEYGHRISCIAVSPNGKYVAAGTGPQGLVFVISPTTGKTVKVLGHGGSTVHLVDFSPDSTRLVSFVPGTLKVWEIEKGRKETEGDGADKETVPEKGDEASPSKATEETDG